MIAIGLTGLARAGKDTVADHLVAEHGFIKLSLAGPLKKMLRTLNPILGYELEEVEIQKFGGEVLRQAVNVRTIRLLDLAHLDEEEIKASPYADEYRRLLQVLGTDCIRSVDPDFWVNAMEKDLREGGYDRVVFNDIRFPNEGALVENLADRTRGAQYGELWGVHRPGITLDPEAHESERYAVEASPFVTLWNALTIGDLHAQIDDEFADLLSNVE